MTREMPDAELEELRRRWRGEGSIAAGAAYLQAAVAAGRLTSARLELIAYLGEPAARVALGEPPEQPLPPDESDLPAYRRHEGLRAWVAGLGPAGGELICRLLVGLTRAVMTEVGEDERALTAIELVEDWIASPPPPEQVAAWAQLRSHAPREGDEPILEVYLGEGWRDACPRIEEEDLAYEVARQLCDPAGGILDSEDEAPDAHGEAAPEPPSEPDPWSWLPGSLAGAAAEAAIWVWWLVRVGVTAGLGAPLPPDAAAARIHQAGERLAYDGRPPQYYEDQYVDRSPQEHAASAVRTPASAKGEAWVRQAIRAELVPWLTGERDPLEERRAEDRDARARRRARLQDDLARRRERERPCAAPTLPPLPDRPPDAALDALWRRWAEGGDAQAGVAYLERRLATRSLPRERVELLSWLGDDAAARVAPLDGLKSVLERYADPRRWGNEVVIRVTVALAHLLLPRWEQGADPAWGAALTSLMGMEPPTTDEVLAILRGAELALLAPTDERRELCRRQAQDLDLVVSAVVCTAGAVGPGGRHNGVWLVARAVTASAALASRYEPGAPDVTWGLPDRFAVDAAGYGLLEPQDARQAILRELRPWVVGEGDPLSRRVET